MQKSFWPVLFVQKMIKFLQKLGPGLLFAGAAIGVSHLVQSTKAGANFGFGLLWALLLINLIKYPFFQFGPRYAAATGESLLNGYKKLGKGVLKVYALLTVATMFTIQTAVTIVTAGIASSLLGDSISIEIWTVIILAICFGILLIGKYALLDKMMKIIIIILSITTLLAVATAFRKRHQIGCKFYQKQTQKLFFLSLLWDGCLHLWTFPFGTPFGLFKKRKKSKYSMQKQLY